MLFCTFVFVSLAAALPESPSTPSAASILPQSHNGNHFIEIVRQKAPPGNPVKSWRLRNPFSEILKQKVTREGPREVAGFLEKRTKQEPAALQASFMAEGYSGIADSMADFTLPEYTSLVVKVFVSWAIWVVLSLLVWASIYPDDEDLQQPIRGPQSDAVKTFESAHFKCFREPTIAFCACVFPGLRWADTMNLSGMHSFVWAFTAFAICALLNGLAYNISIMYGVCTCFLILFYRHRLRRKLNLPNWTPRTCCVDFFYVFLCTCCAIAQEARVVKYQYQQSHGGKGAQDENKGQGKGKGNQRGGKGGGKMGLIRGIFS